jgi:hypothetical protein
MKNSSKRLTLSLFTAETESLIEKGVKAAGARARKSTLEMEKC